MPAVTVYDSIHYKFIYNTTLTCGDLSFIIQTSGMCYDDKLATSVDGVIFAIYRLKLKTLAMTWNVFQSTSSA